MIVTFDVRTEFMETWVIGLIVPRSTTDWNTGCRKPARGPIRIPKKNGLTFGTVVTTGGIGNPRLELKPGTPTNPSVKMKPNGALCTKTPGNRVIVFPVNGLMCLVPKLLKPFPSNPDRK